MNNSFLFFIKLAAIVDIWICFKFLPFINYSYLALGVDFLKNGTMIMLGAGVGVIIVMTVYFPEIKRPMLKYSVSIQG